MFQWIPVVDVSRKLALPHEFLDWILSFISNNVWWCSQGRLARGYLFRGHFSDCDGLLGHCRVYVRQVLPWRYGQVPAKSSELHCVRGALFGMLQCCLWSSSSCFSLDRCWIPRSPSLDCSWHPLCTFSELPEWLGSSNSWWMHIICIGTWTNYSSSGCWVLECVACSSWYYHHDPVCQSQGLDLLREFQHDEKKWAW